MSAMLQSSSMSDEDVVFVARIETSSAEMAEATFDALTAAAWSEYRSILRIVMFEAGIEDSNDVRLERRLEFAKEAFNMVLERTADGSPFRAALKKYADGTAVALIRRGFPPSHLLKSRP